MAIAYAHGGDAHALGHADSIWTLWTFDPGLIVLCVMLVLYVRGFMHGRQRNAQVSQGILRAGSFFTGVFLVILGLCSPIDAFADTSFVWHMIQHMLITLCAVPLILLGAPFLPIAWGIPLVLRHKVLVPLVKWRVLRYVLVLAVRPVVALGHQVAALALWHFPFFYDLALNNLYVHWLEHFHFFVAAMLFWWMIIIPYPFPQRTSPFLRMGLVVLSTFSNSVVSAMIVFASTPLYAYQFLPQVGEKGALIDQRLGGGIMWTMGSMLHLAGLGGLFIALSIRAQKEEPHSQARG